MTVVRHFIVVYNTHCMVISSHLHGANSPPLTSDCIKLQNIVICRMVVLIQSLHSSWN